MTQLRNLTPEEIQDLITYGPRRRIKMTPQLTTIRAMKPGDGILVSHEGLSCANGNCGFRSMITRVQAKNPGVRYIFSHVEGLNSNVMVTCIAVKKEGR